MARGIRIYFGTGTPAPKAVEYDRFMLIVNGSGAPATDQNTVVEITSAEDLVDYNFSSDDQAYKSAALFFGADPSPDRLFVYLYNDEGSTSYTDISLEKVTDTIWETPLKPPTFTGDEQVEFYGCPAGDDGTINKADASQGLGFTVYEDEEGNWTGQLRFLSGLSGSDGIVEEDDLGSNCKITADFSIGSEGGIGEAVEQFNINGIAIALENSLNKTNYDSESDIYFGDDQVDMLLKIRNAIAGKECMFFFALPGNAQPETTIDDATGTVYWYELSNIMGAIEYFAPLKARPSEDDDMAAGYMGMAASTHPHVMLGWAQPHMGIYEEEPKINVSKWDDGQIASIMKKRNLSGEPFLITSGFTFGSGDFSRINGTRCKYIIAQSLRNGMEALLAERDTYCSVSGCERVEERIEGIFNYLVRQGIIDEFVSVNIPLKEDFKNNTEAAQLASQQYSLPGVEVEYRWNTSVEFISITSVDNIAT